MIESDSTLAIPVPEFDRERLLGALKRLATFVTVVHLGATALSLAGGDGLRNAMVAVFGVLFLAGVGACVVAFIVAVSRSRQEKVDIGGAFFLVGSVVPAEAKRRLFVLLGIQVVVGVGAASLAPLTAVAFTVLVPLVGLGLIALTGSLCGVFPNKPDVEY